MAETQQTMTEFTFAPGEKNIIGDRFSPSVVFRQVGVSCLVMYFFRV